MSAHISKTELEHLASLARIELSEHEEEKLLHDLQKIIGHFEELKALESKGGATLAYGVSSQNVFRDDDASENTNQGKDIESFPELHDGFLRIPPVFE